MRRFFRSITAAAAALSLSACHAMQPLDRQAPRHHASTIAHTLRIGDLQDVTSLNPHLAMAVSLGNLSSLTMAYLVRYDRANRPIPELATIVPSKANGLISADGRTITWRLRRGVRWSDGQPFSADDVVFSTRVVNDPKNNELSRAGFDRIQSIDEPDRYTVVYHLRAPFSSFLPTFFGSAGANPCLLPRHLLLRAPDINHVAYNSLPVGIGPFRYVKWIRGDRIEMEANPYYWRGRAKLNKIIYTFVPDRNTLFTQLQTGEIDLWPYVGSGFYQRVNALPAVRALRQPGYRYNHIDFNLTRPVFADRVVRLALRFATDRRTLLAKTAHGLGTLTDAEITPESPLSTALPVTPFSVSRANALLDSAGWQRGADGIRFKGAQRLDIRFAVTSGSADVDAAIELLRTTWAQIGVRLTVLHFSSALMFAAYDQGGIIEAGKFDAAYFSWQMTPDGDLASAHACNQIPPQGENDVHYCNRVTDALLERAARTYGDDARRPILAAVQRQIIADVPEIVTSIPDDIHAFNSDLRGWHPNATTPFDDMLAVDI